MSGLLACVTGEIADDDDIADDDATEDDDSGDDDATSDDDATADDDTADDDTAPSGTAPSLSDFWVGIEDAPIGQLHAYFAYVDSEGDLLGGTVRIWADGESVFVFGLEFPDQTNGAFEFDLPVDNEAWGYVPATLYHWNATLQDREGNLSEPVTTDASTP